MRPEFIRVDEWSLEHCPCGCEARLVHPSGRSAAMHELELSRRVRNLDSNWRLLRRLVVNLWWEVKSSPRRFRKWCTKMLQRGELRRVRREMDLYLLECQQRNPDAGFTRGVAFDQMRSRLNLPPLKANEA